MFQVLNNNIPADCFGYPEINSSWNISKFDTLEEANAHAYHWAMPIDYETAKEWSKQKPLMERSKLIR